jgi:hypothetical protein
VSRWRPDGPRERDKWGRLRGRDLLYGGTGIPLWPHNLLTPLVEDVALTPADRASYRSYADTERYKSFEQMHTTFDHQSSPHDKP